jgi:hypothetical protein
MSKEYTVIGYNGIVFSSEFDDEHPARFVDVNQEYVYCPISHLTPEYLEKFERIKDFPIEVFCKNTWFEVEFKDNDIPYDVLIRCAVKSKVDTTDIASALLREGMFAEFFKASNCIGRLVKLSLITGCENNIYNTDSVYIVINNSFVKTNVSRPVKLTPLTNFSNFSLESPRHCDIKELLLYPDIYNDKSFSAETFYKGKWVPFKLLNNNEKLLSLKFVIKLSPTSISDYIEKDIYNWIYNPHKFQKYLSQCKIEAQLNYDLGFEITVKECV